MRRAAIILGSLFFLASHSADAQDMVALKQLQAKIKDSGGAHVEVGVSVTSSAQTTLGTVFVQCSALDKSGNLADTGSVAIYNLKAGETAYDFVPMLDISDANYNLTCRISSVLD